MVHSTGMMKSTVRDPNAVDDVHTKEPEKTNVCFLTDTIGMNIDLKTILKPISLIFFLR